MFERSICGHTHSPDRPIVVETAIGENQCSLAVHNDVSPIAEELLPRLFEPMSRGGAAAIALSRGGEVEVVSSAEAGTRFTTVFPRAHTEHLPSPKQRVEPSGDLIEQARLRQAELDRLAIGEFEEVVYNDITRLAAEACDVPIALITVVDGERQWFKARVRLQMTQTPRERDAIRSPAEVFVVEDATVDLRFAATPLVTGDPQIRFYAGMPLVTSNGATSRTFCVFDRKPRTLDPGKIDLLRILAKQAV